MKVSKVHMYEPSFMNCYCLENYPETLKAAYVVNASSVFQLVFKLVQALVQQRTLSKIRVLGSDPQLWPEEVRSKMEEYGPEVNRGGQVPRELFLVHGEHALFICMHALLLIF